MHPFVSFGAAAFFCSAELVDSGGLIHSGAWPIIFGNVALAAKLCDCEIFAISTLLAGIMVTKAIYVWFNRLGAGLTIAIIGTNPFLQHYCQK